MPFEAFNVDDGQRGLRLAQRVLDTVSDHLTPPETEVDEGRE
jgi:hypothetical protein